MVALLFGVAFIGVGLCIANLVWQIAKMSAWPGDLPLIVMTSAMVLTLLITGVSFIVSPPTTVSASAR